jgi:hypothetical protein
LVQRAQIRGCRVKGAIEMLHESLANLICAHLITRTS